MSLQGIQDILQRVFGDSFSEPAEWEGAVHNPNSDYTRSANSLRIGVEGTLLSASIRIVSGGPTPGRVYCRMRLLDEQERELRSLCRGYVATGKTINGAGAIPVKSNWQIGVESWSSQASVVLLPRAIIYRGRRDLAGWEMKDEGALEGEPRLRTVTGADPAANAEWSITVDTGARWQVMGVRARLVTSTQSANRFIQLIMDDGTDVSHQIPSGGGGAQVASETIDHNFMEGVPDLDDSTNGVMMKAGKPNAFLESAGRIRSSTLNIKTLDNWGAPVAYVKEWILPI